MMMKTCNKCKKIKPVAEYSKDKNTPSGYARKCKECFKKYYQLNKKTMLENGKIYRRKNYDRLQLLKLAYVERNKAQCNSRRRAWSRKNKDKLIKYRKTALSKGCIQASEQVKKAIKQGLLLNLKMVQIKCADCSNRATVYDHRDYNKPLEVEAVCQRCNLKRGKAISVNS